MDRVVAWMRFDYPRKISIFWSSYFVNRVCRFANRVYAVHGQEEMPRPNAAVAGFNRITRAWEVGAR